MCYVLYLASDRPGPTIDWNPEARAFHVKSEDPALETVRPRFTRPHVAYLGSDDGCGCGFRRDPSWVPVMEDGTASLSQQRNHRQLHDYLAALLADQPSVELFGCWSGDEGLPEETCRTASVTEITDPGFWFAERERVVVVR